MISYLLSRYQQTEAHGAQQPRILPDLIEGSEEWEVEAILGHFYQLGLTLASRPQLRSSFVLTTQSIPPELVCYDYK